MVDGTEEKAAVIVNVEPETETSTEPSPETDTETGEESGDGNAVVETVADSAVEIARIESDRDITLAAIDADKETARIKADKERDDKWHDQEMMSMRERIAALEAENANLTAQLTPPPSPPEAVEMVEVLEPQPATTETMTTNTSETLTEAGDTIRTEADAESAVEKLADQVDVKVRRAGKILMI